MVISPALVIITTAILLLLALSALVRWARQVGPSSIAASESPSNTAARHIHRSVVIAFVFAAILVLAIAALATAMPGLFGLPLALAPGVAMSAGLLLFACTTAPRTVDTPTRRASLDSRHFWSFGGPRDFLPPLLTSFALIAFLLWTGASSSADETGLYRTITVISGDTTSISSPYPGWFYGGPLIAVTLLLLGSALAALARIATTPAPPLLSADGEDSHWRRAATRVVSTMTTAALLAYFGGVAIMAGITTRSASTTHTSSGEVLDDRAIVTATTMLIGGTILALASLASALAAIALSTTLLRRASAVFRDSTDQSGGAPATKRSELA